MHLIVDVWNPVEKNLLRTNADIYGSALACIIFITTPKSEKDTDQAMLLSNVINIIYIFIQEFNVFNFLNNILLFSI